MRLGCAAYSYRLDLQSGALTLEGFVDTCAELGLEGVELTAYYFPSTERAYLNRLKRHCFRRGMHILATAIGSNFTIADADRRREQVRAATAWIEHSVALGAPCMRVFAGPVAEGVAEETASGWAIECLRECVEYAANQGVVIALENHGGVTARADQVLRIAAALESQWFGLNLDFGNFRDDPYAEIEQAAPLAVTTHAKVATRSAGGVVPVDYRRVRRIMEGVGYQGYISVEYEESEPAATAVPRFVGQLQEALAR